jgi:hypothetical protein
MMFRSNCLLADKARVKKILMVENSAHEEKYLGLPIPEKRIDKGKFKTTKERLSKKFTNWAERYMLVSAKEVLIKSVAQAIPTYAMGVFKLPATLGKQMTRMIKCFWWGDEDGHRKVHWIAWE